MNWTTIGKDAHMAKVPGGFMHVMRLGANVWSVTLNGRIVGSSTSADEGKRLAESAAS